MAIIIPITSLTVGSQVKSTDVYPAVDITDTTQSTNGTTKQYKIDQLLGFILQSIGFVYYQPVLAASTVALTAAYNNGISGIGRTLTNSGTQAAFTLDGQDGILNQRYLIKNQTDAAQNGIYALTVIGSGTSNWLLTGVPDFNTSANIHNGGLVYVENGTVNDETMWQLSCSEPVVVGTTLLNWSAFNFIPLTNFTWNVVSGTTQAIEMQNGYITSNVAQTVLTLPTTATVGQTFRIAGFGTGGWRLAQNASQLIAIGSSTTSTGVLGYLESTNARDSIEVICVTANIEFLVLDMIGNLTVT